VEIVLFEFFFRVRLPAKTRVRPLAARPSRSSRVATIDYEGIR